MRLTCRLLIPLLFAILCAGSGAWANERTIAMNFSDAEIESVVKSISEFTGKSFIIDDKVRGKKITVISPLRLNPDEAWDVFTAILNVKGFAVVPSGKVYFAYAVVVSADGKGYTAEAAGDLDGDGSAQYWGFLLPDGNGAKVTAPIGCDVNVLQGGHLGPCDLTFGQSVF